jgi:PAS domain S-box-containing protein
MVAERGVLPGAILDAMNVGVYVCDRHRRIVYWSKRAETITGWRPEDVLGHGCNENILNHVDKDGRPLCGEESCPLHRSMVTGVEADVPILVFAKGKDGRHIAMQVNAAPLRNEAGDVIGGVETFRDLTAEMPGLRRARQIQQRLLRSSLPQDSRVMFTVFYRARDIVGGDFYAIHAETEDCYAFMLADVEGHGLAAALNTVHLNRVWHRNGALRLEPGAFATAANNDLVAIFGPDNSFATAVSGVFDAGQGILTLSFAGGPPALLLQTGAAPRWVHAPGIPLGISENSSYTEITTTLEAGDQLMLCTDGVFEIHNALQEELGMDGFLNILGALDYPRRKLRLEYLEEELLKYSNAIQLQDDLTLILLAVGAEPPARKTSV